MRQSLKWVSLLITFLFTLLAVAFGQTELFSYSAYDSFEIHPAAVRALVFDYQGKLLASADKNGTIIVRDLENKRIVQRLEGHKKAVNALSFRADGEYLASASDDKTVRLWSLKDGSSKVLQGHNGEVLAVSFSPSGNLLASAGADKQVILWSVDTATLIGSHLEHKKKVSHVLFLKDESLFSAGEDKKLIEWDVKAKRVLRSWEVSGDYLNSVAAAPNGDWLAIGIETTAMQKGGAILGSSRPDALMRQNEIKIYSVASGSLQKNFDVGKGQLPAISVSADSNYLAAVNSGMTKSSVVIWDVKRGEQIAVIEPPTKEEMTAIRFSPNGKWLASGNEKGKINIWKTQGIYPGPAIAQTTLRGQKNVFLTSREPLFSFSKNTTLALLDLDALGVDPTIAQALSEQIRARVSGTKNVRLIERQRIEKVLKEINFQNSGATDAATAARVGKILNVTKMGFGSVSKFGRDIIISVQLVDVESAANEGIRQIKCSQCADEELIETVAEFQVALVSGEKAPINTSENREDKIGNDPINAPPNRQAAVPQIKLTYPNDSESVEQPELALRGIINDPAGLTKITVQVSGSTTRKIAIAPSGNATTNPEIIFKEPVKSYDLNHRLVLSPGSNVITITAENKEGLKEQVSRVIYLEDKGEKISRSQTIANRWAFVVGISDYQDTNIKGLQYAHKDAEDLFKFLQTPSGGAYKPENMVLLTNKDATWERIREELREFLSKPEPDDLVFLYFAAHASPDPYQPNNVYLITYNTKLSKMLGTALSVNEIELALRENLRANKVVMFADTCYSASFGVVGTRDARTSAESINAAFDEAVRRSKPGTFIVTSALGNQLSQESEIWGGGHGVFTWYLLQGLQGKADKDTNGYVTTQEVFDYIYENVKRETKGRQYPANLSHKYDPNLPLAIVGAKRESPPKR